jgi:hypothetical protein
VHLPSGLDGGVAYGDERAESGAVQEGNSGEVDLDDGRILTMQRVELVSLAVVLRRPRIWTGRASSARPVAPFVVSLGSAGGFLPCQLGDDPELLEAAE